MVTQSDDTRITIYDEAPCSGYSIWYVWDSFLARPDNPYLLDRGTRVYFPKNWIIA